MRATATSPPAPRRRGRLPPSSQRGRPRTSRRRPRPGSSSSSPRRGCPYTTTTTNTLGGSTSGTGSGGGGHNLFPLGSRLTRRSCSPSPPSSCHRRPNSQAQTRSSPLTEPVIITITTADTVLVNPGAARVGDDEPLVELSAAGRGNAFQGTSGGRGQVGPARRRRGVRRGPAEKRLRGGGSGSGGGFRAA